MTETKRLLISLAHPDDESFGYGALIGRCIADGIEVYYLCATNGDVGTVDPAMLNGYNSIAELRLAELDCASEILGFKKVFKLGYKDSGMMNTDANNHPDSLWYNWQHDSEDVLQKVTRVIRQVRPQVILTFNRYGGYGHPDHIAIQRATTQAFELAGDANFVTDGVQPHKPHKLYYSSFPKIFAHYTIWRTRLKGKDPRKMGRNKDIDYVKILKNIEPAHLKLNIQSYFDLWERASACHKSQGGGSQNQEIILKLLRYMFGRHSLLTRIYPQPPANRIDETDLFANIDLKTIESTTEHVHS